MSSFPLKPMESAGIFGDMAHSSGLGRIDLANEKHYSSIEISKLWALSQKTVRKIFESEPSVIKTGAEETLAQVWIPHFTSAGDCSSTRPPKTATLQVKLGPFSNFPRQLLFGRSFPRFAGVSREDSRQRCCSEIYSCSIYLLNPPEHRWLNWPKRCLVRATGYYYLEKPDSCSDTPSS